MVALHPIGKPVGRSGDTQDYQWKSYPGKFRTLKDFTDKKVIRWTDQEDIRNDQQGHEAKGYDLNADKFLVEGTAQLRNQVRSDLVTISLLGTGLLFVILPMNRFFQKTRSRRPIAEWWAIEIQTDKDKVSQPQSRVHHKR